MAESPTQQPPSSQSSPINDSHQLNKYWCHQCSKTVDGETLDNNEVVCSECNDGFVVAIPPSLRPTYLDLLHQFMQLLEREELPSSHPSNRLHVNVERRGTRASSDGRTRLQHIREIYQNSGIAYVGNYLDYADEAEYESILNNFAENDDGGNRGAPPAAESAVAALKDKKIESENEDMVCVVCKDLVTVGETAKELPCGHGYHGDCIAAWLATRNMCPVCRYELPTSDPDYEKERIKKNSGDAAGGSSKAGNDSADQ